MELKAQADDPASGIGLDSPPNSYDRTRCAGFLFTVCSLAFGASVHIVCTLDRLSRVHAVCGLLRNYQRDRSARSGCLHGDEPRFCEGGKAVCDRSIT